GALNIRMRVDAVGDHARAARSIDEVLPVRIVSVEYGGLRHAFLGTLAEHLEEDPLRLEIALQDAVEIKMLRREVGEDGDIHLAAAPLAQRKRMRRCLEHARCSARRA